MIKWMKWKYFLDVELYKYQPLFILETILITIEMIVNKVGVVTIKDGIIKVLIKLKSIRVMIEKKEIFMKRKGDKQISIIN